MNEGFVLRSNTSQICSTAFQLDVISDTICPWCYVGKRRLAAALSVLAADGLALEIT